MYNIGIIGSDNSHAIAFSSLCNKKNAATGEYLFPDFRVTHIFGVNQDENQKVVQDGLVQNVVTSPDEMFGNVDGVMVVFRHGDLHLQYALPFIKRGIPTWIDKPFTIKIEDAITLINEAEENKTLLTGGSTCKYANDILDLADDIVNQKQGRVLGGAMNFPTQLDSIYGGFYFYGGHLSEMILASFGYDPRSVYATINGDNIYALLRYDNYIIGMNFLKDCYQYCATVYTDKKVYTKNIDISTAYENGFGKFAEMLKTKELPLSFDKLIKPVYLLNAIENSIKSGKEVDILG
jgi:predicted dehydrogenase